jgi:hypothetical protein
VLDLLEISDRIELQQLHAEYADAIDQRNWDGLDDVFTADAFIDYTALGGIAGPYSQVKAWLIETLDTFPSYYHLVSNISLTISGDTATGRAVCFNPVVMAEPDGGRHPMFFGLWYQDTFRRTAAGWRVTERRERYCFDFNVPKKLRATPE